MKLLKKLRFVRIKSYKEDLLYLYGFMLFSGSVESDNHNGKIEKFENRWGKVEKNFFAFVWLHALKTLYRDSKPQWKYW